MNNHSNGRGYLVPTHCNKIKEHVFILLCGFGEFCGLGGIFCVVSFFSLKQQELPNEKQ